MDFFSAAEILPDLGQGSDMFGSLPRIGHTLAKAAGNMQSGQIPPSNLSSEHWELYDNCWDEPKLVSILYPANIEFGDRPPTETCEALKVNWQMMIRTHSPIWNTYKKRRLLRM